ncbi:TPA: hypothetical protein ACH3X1_007209 [Trebouxia sp. C0004]
MACRDSHRDGKDSWEKKRMHVVRRLNRSRAQKIASESVPAKLPKTQAEVLDHFVNHVLRPSWKSSQPEGYENLYRKGRPDLLGKREDVCFAVNALDFR